MEESRVMLEDAEVARVAYLVNADLRRQRLWRIPCCRVCACLCRCCCPNETAIRLSEIPLSSNQKSRFSDIRRQATVVYNRDEDEHAQALHSFAMATLGSEYFDDNGETVTTEGWSRLGFQGKDPATDFRAGGLLSLQNLSYFVHTNKLAFHRIMNFCERAETQYLFPFAIVGINITYKLVRLLSLATTFNSILTKREASVLVAFLDLLETDQYAFQEIYCSTMVVLFDMWTKESWKYMEFQGALGRTLRLLSLVLHYFRPATLPEFQRRMLDWEANRALFARITPLSNLD